MKSFCCGLQYHLFVLCGNLWEIAYIQLTSDQIFLRTVDALCHVKLSFFSCFFFGPVSDAGTSVCQIRRTKWGGGRGRLGIRKIITGRRDSVISPVIDVDGSSQMLTIPV